MAGKFLFHGRFHDAPMRMFRDDLPGQQMASTPPDKPQGASSTSEILVDDEGFDFEAAAAEAKARKEKLDLETAGNVEFARESDRKWGRRSIDAQVKLSPVERFVAASDARWSPEKAPTVPASKRALSPIESFVSNVTARWARR